MEIMDLKSKQTKIDECVAETKQQLMESRQALSALQGQTGRLIAMLFLGETTEDAVIEHKNQVAYLETSIDDAAAALRGLETLAVECVREMAKEAKEQSRLKAHTRYEELKARAQELGNPNTYNRQLESDIRQAAVEVKMRDEADVIIREQTKRRDNQQSETCQPVN